MRFDVGLRGLPGKFFKVDADRECANYGTPSPQTDQWMGYAGLDNSFGKQALQTGHEVCPVMITLETDDVELQQGIQNRRLPGEFFKHVRPGKRDVEEKSHGRADSSLPHGVGGEHEVIVMHPDEVVVRCYFRGHLS